jgi:hypothetical protein
MADYRLVGGGVQRTADGAFIPNDPRNADWQAYQAWLSEGGEPDPIAGPSPDDLLAGKLAGGIAITWTGGEVLSGTYSIDTDSQGQIAGIIAMIGAGLGLPMDADTLPWPDTDGAPHAFDADQFKILAKAVRDYVSGLRQTWGALKAGQPAPWPPQPIVIVS